MAQTQSIQQNAPNSQERGNEQNRPLWARVIVVVITVFVVLMVVGAIILVLVTLGIISLSLPWSNKISNIVLVIMIPLFGVLIPVLQWLRSLSDKDPPQTSIAGIQPPWSPVFLPTIGNVIYNPVQIIEDIYAKLTQESITALMLVGNPGVGKSTLSALLYHYVEEQRRTQEKPFFAAAPLWYTVDANSTISDLGQKLLSGLGKSIPNFESLPAQNQALALINALNTSTESRLIVFDQFETLFDQSRASGSSIHPGIDEFLDALNRQAFQHSHCRILLTSTSIPWWSSEHTLIHMLAHPVKGFDYMQGMELLKKRSQVVQEAFRQISAASTTQDTSQNTSIEDDPPTKVVSATLQPEQVQAATKQAHNIEAILERLIRSYHGNALALTLLAAFLDQLALISQNLNGEIHLIDLLNNRQYAALWSGSQPLDFIYQQQLNSEERQVLRAFAVYREPVPLAAALAVDTSISLTEAALTEWPLRYLLMELEIGCYQLHPATAYFIRNRFDPSSEDDNRQTLRTAHIKAAEYYMHRAATDCPPKEQRWTTKDVHAFSEAAWHYCVAGEWQKAYDVIEQEELYFTLSHSGGAPLLLELYQLLLPPNRWHATSLQAASIYNNLGEVYAMLEKREEAIRYFKEALSNIEQEQEQEQNLRGKGRTLYNLGLVYSVQGQELQFWGYLEEEWDNLSSADQSLDPAKQRLYRQQAAAVQQYLQLATRYLEQALGLRRYVGDRAGTGKTLRALGHVYGDSGRSKQALFYYEEALVIAREVNDEVEIGRVLHDLGQVCNKLGKKKQSKAVAYLEEALNILHTYKDIIEEGRTRNTLGRVYYDMAKIPSNQKIYYEKEKLIQGREYYQQALFIGREVGDRRGVAIALYNIGMFFFDQGQHDNMLACILLARAIIEEIQGYSWNKAEEELLLPKKPDKQEFEDLIKKVRPDMFSIVKNALQEDFPEESASPTSPYLSFSLLNSPAPFLTAEKPKETGEPDQDEEVEDQQQRTA